MSEEQIEIKEPEALAKRKRKFAFHPKRLLKNAQQRLYLSSKLYLIFCFIAPIAIMYICYLVKGLYPFSTGSPLVLDLNAQYVYFFEALRSFVYGDGSLLYSFSRSLGGEFMGIYAYYMASPLTYIVALFPVERIQEAVLCLLLLKTGLSGLTMGIYLHQRTKNPNRLVIFTFSLMYALSAYMMIQQNNTMWIDALIWLPIFTYALEKLITQRKYKLYVISLSAILICNYYIGYMVCIFAVLYFFYYYFCHSKNEINPRGERLHFIRTGGRFAAFSLLSAAISAFMLIAAYYSLGFGKSDFSNPDWSLKANFEVLDFMAKFLPGSFDTVEPAGLPFVYCGLLVLFAVPIYFTARNVSIREKIASAALIAVFILSFIVSPIDLIWHGFSVPNWINGRYSFLFCFFLIIVAYKGFGNLKQTTERFLLGIGAFIVLFAATAEKFKMEPFINSNEKLMQLGCIWFSIFFAIALTVLLCLRLRTKNRSSKRSVAAVLCAVVCLELTVNGIVCFLMFHKDVGFTTYKSYNESLALLRPVVEQVEDYDGGFYRMEKVRHRTKNDNMALGMKGITSSTSTLNSDAINFVNKIGYTGRAHLTMYRGGTPFSDSMLGIKYVIDNETSTIYSHSYDELTHIESSTYNVFENPHALSLAYGVDRDLHEFSLDDYDNYFKRHNAIAAAMLGEEENIPIFKSVYNVKPQGNSCDINYGLLSVKCKTEKTLSGTVTFSYIAPYSGDYFFYATATEAEEMAVKLNGKSLGNYLGRDTNHILRLGYHTEGSPIEISFTIPKDTETTFHTKNDFLWYMDTEVYNDCMTRLKAAPQLSIDPASTDDHITGSIVNTSYDSQMIMTTIPYDEGWSVFIDGEEVEIYETLDALIAFDIDGMGEHTVEMKYMPDCYYVGAAISIIGIVVFIALCVLELVLKRTLFKNRIPVYPDEFWVLEDFDIEEAPFSIPPKPTEGQDSSEATDTDEKEDKN